MQPRTRRSSKWETSGRLGIFTPQISRDKNVENNNKTHDKELVKNNKKHIHVTLVPRVTRGTLNGQATQLTDTVLSNIKTSASCNNNNEDKNYHLHFDKKIEGRLCCCGVPHKSDHWQPTQVKRAKRKRLFLHSWTTISNFTDTVLMGLDSIDADFNRPDDVMNQFVFDKWRSTTSRTSESTLSIKFLKSYNTNQDYTIVNNCLVWKQQTLTVQFLW